jgi:hypothetical protein
LSSWRVFRPLWSSRLSGSHSNREQLFNSIPLWDSGEPPRTWSRIRSSLESSFTRPAGSGNAWRGAILGLRSVGDQDEEQCDKADDRKRPRDDIRRNDRRRFAPVRIFRNRARRQQEREQQRQRRLQEDPRRGSTRSIALHRLLSIQGATILCRRQIHRVAFPGRFRNG